MFFELAKRTQDFTIHALRRKELIRAIRESYPHIDEGLVVLFGNFEDNRNKFKQNSTFYYYTGINEPGLVLTIDLEGTSILYTPCHDESRLQWVTSHYDLNKSNAKKFGLNGIEVLGTQCIGYQFGPFAAESFYATFLQHINQVVDKQQTLFVLNPDNADEYIEQRFMIMRLCTLMPKKIVFKDISSLVAQARRRKDMREIELLHKAIEITMMAHDAAAQAIGPNVLECEVQASIEFIMTSSGARPAFPSIVAGGKNGTILHYIQNSMPLEKGDLVVVDIGAEYENYCADITRTYPVSGKFTEQQRELYTIVLDTQHYIADIAKPGYWLSNAEIPEQSLNHLAREYLRKKGYDSYFVHGIGHYLGLDVHDVGNYTQPLQEGDVITVEPGIYMPEKNIGIRIEDNYWLVKDGAVCLSEALPKEISAIEEMMQTKSTDDVHNLEDVLDDDYSYEAES